MASVSHIYMIGPRACGKSSTAKLLAEKSVDWTALDIDHVYESRNRSWRRSQLMVHADHYYEGCREIVAESYEASEIVVAMGGGTLINPHYPSGDIDTLIECKKRGPMVLVLPTAFDFRNRRILYQREVDRAYNLPGSMMAKLKSTTYAQYDRRIDFFRKNADFTVYGTDLEKIVAKIMKNFALPAKDENA